MFKFIKLTYQYYKGANDTNPDLNKVFGFVHSLDNKQHKKLKAKFDTYPIANKIYTGLSYRQRLDLQTFKSNTFGYDLQKWFKNADVDLFKESLKTIKPKTNVEAKFFEHAMFQHDVIHMLNKYDTSPMGEVMVLSFNLAKEWRWSYFAILFSSLFMAIRNSFSIKKSFPGTLWQKIKYAPIVSYVRLVREGYKVGKQAPWIMAVDFELFWNLPTNSVRKALKIKKSYYWEHILPAWTKLHKKYQSNLQKEK